LKKLITTLIFLCTSLLSSEVDVAAKIIDKISVALTKKEKIKVYTNDIKNLYIVKISEHLNNSKSCVGADLVLTKDKSIYNCDKDILVFTTNYLSFKSLPNAVGAFFYQKGRPSIIFRKEVLKRHNIVLSNEFNKYIE